LTEAGAYMVTAGIHHKAKLLNTPDRLCLVLNLLFEFAECYKWRLQAWAILSNHYHFVALSPDQPESLKTLVNQVHSLSAKELNRRDGVKGRKVWFQYWDSHITFERSYLARLNYVHNNPVHHGLVANASDYQFCSAGWFELNTSSAFKKTVYGFKTNRLNVADDF